MRKISELRGEDALDVLADILEPASEIMTDNKVAELARSGDRIRAVSVAIKSHKRAVIKILAALEGEDYETYKPALLTLPLKLLEIFNDPDVVQVFTLQGQKTESASFGSATENTEEQDG